MVRIRLWRGGKKNRPSYRVVVVDSKNRRDGRVIENVGHYDPLTDPATIQLSIDRIHSWINKGARMSDSVRSLMKKVETLPQSQTPTAPEPVSPPPSPES